MQIACNERGTSVKLAWNFRGIFVKVNAGITYEIGGNYESWGIWEELSSAIDCRLDVRKINAVGKDLVENSRRA